MAREQVKELATRGVRPASIQAGTTPVVVQQAAEPKIMGLARALGGVNKALGNYTSLVEHASAAEESRILSLTSEERASELEKMEENFDKMERKGQIPFLSNPVSWKRKYRAMGVGLANDLYNEMVSDTGRLNSPEEGDGELALDDILGQEIGKFFEDNPQLYNQPTMTDEFYRAWEAKARAIQSEYGGRQAALTKSTIATERTNEIYRIYKDIVVDSPGDRIFAQERMHEAWKEMSFLNATQQAKVIASIAESLADSDPEIVQEFLEDAEDLKVGGATFGKNTKAVDDIAEKVSDIMEANEEENRRKVNRDRAEKKAADDAAYDEAKYKFLANVSDLQRKGSVEFNGNTYSSISSLREAYLDKVDADYKDTNESLRGQIANYINNEFSTITRDDTALSWILQRSDQDEIQANTNVTFQSDIRDAVEIIKAESVELAREARVEIQDIQAAARLKIGNLGEKIAVQVMKLGFSTDQQIQEINERYEKAANDVVQQTRESINAIKERKLKTQSDNEKAQIELAQSKDAGKVVSTRGTFDRKLKPMDTIDRLRHNISLLTEEYPDADKKKAIQEIKRGEDMDLYLDIANDTAIKHKGFESVSGTGLISVPDVPYSEEERKKALDYIILRKALGGEFTKLSVLQNQRISQIGTPFDPKKLNPAIHFILTEEEINRGADDAVVIEKARIIDYGPKELIEVQEKTYKKFPDIPNLF